MMITITITLNVVECIDVDVDDEWVDVVDTMSWMM